MCPTVIGQCSAAFQQSTQVPVCAERFDHRIKFILEFLRFMLHLVIVPRGVKLFSGAVEIATQVTDAPGCSHDLL
jgi:hypothetical protein